MKITTLNNAEIVIQANVSKPGDYEAALKVANEMMAMDDVEMDIASVDETEQWVHVCARWDHYQASEIKASYQTAKANAGA